MSKACLYLINWSEQTKANKFGIVLSELNLQADAGV